MDGMSLLRLDEPPRELDSIARSLVAEVEQTLDRCLALLDASFASLGVEGPQSQALQRGVRALECLLLADRRHDDERLQALCGRLDDLRIGLGLLVRRCAEGHPREPPPMADGPAVPELLARLMAERAMTSRALATLLGVTPAFVSQLRHGKRGVSRRMAGKLAEVFDTPVLAWRAAPRHGHAWR